MVILAAIETVIVVGGVLLYIWRLQFTFPDCAIFLLAFIVLTFLLHRDSFQNLGMGSHGFISGLKALAVPTLIIAASLIINVGTASAFKPDINYRRFVDPDRGRRRSLL